jgi:rare lipoprotein A
LKRALLALGLAALAACTTTQAPQPAAPAPATTTHGSAGWVGQEFAGRTTANGEIFDPMLMTASHRTLPFGTLVDVRNPKTSQSVRVRINDRGPYVGDRLIDLSYAAAKQIGLVESGGGEVDMTVVTVGRGDHEPPAPFAVEVPETISVAPAPAAVTPAPAPAPAQPQPAPAPITIDNVQVVEQHGGVETRRQVAANGTSIVDVPVNGGTPVPVPATPTPKAGPIAAATPTKPHVAHFVVQVGAFSQEVNANALQKKLKAIGQDAFVDHTSLFHVRIGPFATREQAVSVRSRLETAGISAIIVTE